ncbi:hypothetical protein ACFLVS_02635 [Chloroflexota bacterium]
MEIMMILRRHFRFLLLGLVLLLFVFSVFVLSGCSNSATVPAENESDEVQNIWAEIIPEEGTKTEYGIPLSLENTQQFIDWYNSITLSTEEKKEWDQALGSLVAPCCDDFKMNSC